MPLRAIAPADWDSAKREAREALIATARSAKGMITYGQLCERISSLKLEPDSEVLRLLLGEISTEEDAEGRGMLTVVVVHQGGNGRPGSGFFKLASRLGRDTHDRDQFWTKEFAKVREAWKKDRG